MSGPFKLPRYNVRRCEDGTSLPDQDRPVSWDVLDRVTGYTVSNHRTRCAARTAAKEMNHEAFNARSVA